MGAVLFDERDAELLYSFPKPPSDLLMIIRCFTFINRCAAPTYAELSSCLTKAMGVGIIREVGREFVVEDAWYERIHKADDTAENEIESMLEFEESFVKVPFDGTAPAGKVLSEDEYETILASLRQERLQLRRGLGHSREPS